MAPGTGQPEASGDDGARTSHVFMFPVEGLTIDSVWSLGVADIHPARTATTFIEKERAARTNAGSPPLPAWYAKWIADRFSAKFTDHAIALAPALDAKAAFQLVGDALGVLRLFAGVRSPQIDTELQTFGLEGEIASWTAEYIDLDVGPGHGWFREGPVAAWSFNSHDREAFAASSGFQFLTACLQTATDSRTLLQRRVHLGQRLLNSAILDQNADRKLLSLVSGLEVLFGEKEWQGKGYGLARRIAFLTCSIPTNTMCGRDGPSCPYLALDPSRSKGEVRRLEDFVKAAAADDGLRCARYLEIISLYRARNDAVHEGSCGLDLDGVRRLAYPIYRWLLPTFLDWCAQHPQADLSLLDDEIDMAVRTWPPPG